MFLRLDRYHWGFMRTMRFLAFLTLATLFTLPIYGNQFLFSWVDGPGGNYGASHTFTISGMSITALVYNDDGSTTGNALFGKNAGTGETGLGTTADKSGDNEIVYADYVQLDFSSVQQNYTITSATLGISSLQGTEAYAVYGANSRGGTLTKPAPGSSGTVTSSFTSSTPLTTGISSITQPFDITSYVKGPNSYSDLVITETAAPTSLGSTTQPNILLGQLSINATPNNTQSPVPEPSFFGLIGLSLVCLAAVTRKARRI
jgi:hypothetical protein